MSKFSIILLSICSIVLITIAYFARTSLPIPWNDELHFLLPSLAFAERWSFFAPELHPSRALMWMPPGYYVIMGLYFKLAPFSLEAARALSMAFLLMALALCFKVLDLGRFRPLSYITMGLVFCLPSVFVAGNFARMDVLILLATLSALYLVLQGRFILAIAMAALATLIHFNGIFIGFAVLLVVMTRSLSQPYDDLRTELERHGYLSFGVLLLATILWVLYGLYIVQHWPEFIHDIRFQLERKAGRDPFVLQLKVLVPTLVAAGLLAMSLWKSSKENRIVASFGFALMLIYTIGQEMTYYNFAFVGLGLLSVSAAENASLVLTVRRQKLLAMVLIGLIIGLQVGFSKGFSYRYASMIPADRPYLPEIYQKQIVRELEDIAQTFPNAAVNIEFMGAPLYFIEDMRRLHLRLKVATDLFPDAGELDFKICFYNPLLAPQDFIPIVKDRCPNLSLNEGPSFVVTKLSKINPAVAN